MKFRQVHLDFHTSEKIENIGAKFDKKNFQEALKIGHIESVTLFSKCHHGWAYHPTEANEIHPNLKFDLLGMQIDAAHEIGVNTPVYLSAGLDEKMARRHPEWLVRNKDESTTWVSDFSQAGYHKFCMASPYLEYLAKQIEEVCQRYDADGIFLDIAGVQPCYCQNCIADRKKMGLEPYNEEDVIKHAELIYERYAKRTRKAVDKYKPGLPLFHNGGHIRHGRRDLARYNTHIEVESLPTGGWGWDHFPFSARYCQNLGMEVLGMTGKFHSSWGEFGGFKHPNALRYEVALSAANGTKCSIGDQLLPSGEMDMVTYNLIGSAYSELEEKQPWLNSVESIADVAVFSPEAYTGIHDTGQMAKVDNTSSGISRIMLEGKYLFDIVDYESSLDKYKVVVLPDVVRISPEFEDRLSRFCKNGGKILATGKSALRSNNDEFCFDLGAQWKGKQTYNPDYFRPKDYINGMGSTSYVMYGRGENIDCTGVELGIRENPYFNRSAEHFCSHLHTPSSGEYGGAGMTEGKDGIYIAWSVFEDYALSGNLAVKQMVIYAIDRLLGKNKTLETTLPAQGITTLMKQGKRLINHLLYVTPVKRGKDIEVVEDIIPLYDIEVKINAQFLIKNVYLAPQMKNLEFENTDSGVVYKVPKMECHQMVVLDIE